MGRGTYFDLDGYGDVLPDGDRLTGEGRYDRALLCECASEEREEGEEGLGVHGVRWVVVVSGEIRGLRSAVGENMVWPLILL